MSFKWVAGGKKITDMQIQCCYIEKLYKLRISLISIAGRCLVSTSREAYCWIGWVGIASGQVSGRVGYWVRVFGYQLPDPTQP